LGKAAMRLLIDVNVPRAAAVSKDRLIGEKAATWGNQIIRSKVIEHGPAYPDVDRFLRLNIPFIPSLAIEGRKQGMEFFTYALLDFERWKVLPAIDWAQRDIHMLFEFQEIKFEIKGGAIVTDGRPDTFKRFLTFLERQFDDPLLHEIEARMEERQSRDCCHAFIAHHFDLDGFVTLDGDFIGPFNQIAGSLGIRTRCFSPKDICGKMRIDRIDEGWFAARSDPFIFYEPV
jgi:hypothetical protein